MKLKIKNFGPIKNGFGEDGFMEITDFTMFIGPPGSGKSTIAKALSTLMWIEKALIRGDFTDKELKLPGRFRARFDFHNIKSYFSDDSVIEYVGPMYHIAYRGEGKLEIERVEPLAVVSIPKIMYVPSERNFISVIPTLSVIRDLSPSFIAFLDEYNKAQKNLKEELELPINDVFFSYDKLNDIPWVKRHENKTRLSQSASGFQSLIPLYLVSAFLANEHKSSFRASSGQIVIDKLGPEAITTDNLKKLHDELQEGIKNKQDVTNLIHKAQKMLASMNPSHFINIVEEPEQNLFPEAQINMMFALLSFRNYNEKNKLIVTTHSPYLINAISLAAAAKKVYDKEGLSTDVIRDLELIVPWEATIGPEQLRVYKTDGEGNVSLLENIDGIPSDENYLNDLLGDFNENFGKILELGDE